MYIYVYENHLGGGYYITEEEQDYNDLYCETCGDSDELIFEGEAEDWLAMWKDDVKQAIARYRYIKGLVKTYLEENNDE